ncbi:MULTISPECIES: SAM-dependent methyltransferase [Flavobacterium]|uniref:SAM-dependent methyltransferase n=1 Tax=Flavobacterium jumunjinense TaxID=998845 RepID=A0ABV5GU23_9FLAO|nr:MULTISPECIES: SAM-dependent methyltransferase [Flavobacterium]
MNKEYWEKRYIDNETAWDVGSITTPLKQYIDQIKNKELKILIPGAGNSHEFDYVIKSGFKNTFVIDIAKPPIENIKSRNPELKEQIIEGDFFELDMKFDLIIEQTFFCALDISLRENYSKKIHELLNPKGKVAGLLFNFPLTEEGPPFGGEIKEYISLFSSLFKIRTLEKSYNSIKPRSEKELFFIFEKK